MDSEQERGEEGADGRAGELFALTPYLPSKSNSNGGVEAVLDSSRYFVLTVVDAVRSLLSVWLWIQGGFVGRDDGFPGSKGTRSGV